MFVGGWGLGAGVMERGMLGGKVEGVGRLPGIAVVVTVALPA